MSFRQPNNAGSYAELEIELTEDDLCPNRIDNMASVHPCRDDFSDLGDLAFSLLASILIKTLQEETGSLRSITGYYDRYLDLPRGTSLAIIRHLLANRVIRINMLKPINLDERLTLQYPQAPKENDSQEDQNDHHHQLRSNKSLDQPNTNDSLEANSSETSSSTHKLAVKRSVGSNGKGMVEKVFNKINHDLIDINLVQAKE